MILERFHDENLAQASWLIGCAASGDAIVVDPLRDIDPYLRVAESKGLEIRHVTETHIHADFVSGLRQMVARTGATAYLSREGGPGWEYTFADGLDARLLGDGDAFMVGNIRFDVMHTPGHTPEHLTFLVTDTAGADRPIGALTGDFVFVGDVGRPDLLEKAAGVTGTMAAGARDLYRSLERFRELPDWLQIWPGHGAGSACGKGLSSIPHSTLGYERQFNWAFAAESEAAFVAAVLDGQPEPPTYFAVMKRMNRDGPPVLHGVPEPDVGTLAKLQRLASEGVVSDGASSGGVASSGAWIVDTRSAVEFGAGHVPGTLNIPLDRSFTTWAGWLLPYDQDVFLIVDQEHVEEAMRGLAMIGLDRVGAVFPSGVVDAWAEAGGELGTVRTRSPGEVEAALLADEATVVDVRGTAEWRDGHLEGVDVVPTGYLPDRLDELPRDRELVLHCRTGARSAIAVSLLQRAGFDSVSHMRGGYVAWEARGLPTVHEAAIELG